MSTPRLPKPDPHADPLAYARWRLGPDITHAHWTGQGLVCQAAGMASSLLLVAGPGLEWDCLCERLLGAAESTGDRLSISSAGQ